MLYLEDFHKEANTILQTNSGRKLRKIQDLQDKRDYQLFDYVHRLVNHLQVFRTVATPIHTKSNESAEKSRLEGNELLAAPKFDLKKALAKFSTSVAYAQPDSEQLSLAYSDRSRLFFDQRFYKECVRDIERALKCNPSKDLKQTLQVRRKQVEEFKQFHKTLDYHAEVPRLPKSKNKQIQCATRSVDLNTNDKFGRHVVAKKDISVGEMLVIEEPYVKKIFLSQQFLHCHECLELCYDLIPCPNCPEALYCKNVCREKAFQEYHKYECIIFQHGLQAHRLTLKLALKAVINCESFLADLSIDEPLTFRSNRYKDVANMKTFKELMKPNELFLCILDPVIFYHFLTKYTGILNDLHCDRDQKETVLKEILVKNSYLAINNNFSIEKTLIKKDSQLSQINMASGTYPFYSNFQHSCICNTAMVFYGSKMVIYAIANIKQGEQITTNYGTWFYDRTKEERIKLLSKYYYTCQCPACENDWPLRDTLRDGTPVPMTLQKKMRQFIASGIKNRPGAKPVLEKAYEFYNQLKITEEMPFYNRVLIQELILNTLRLLGNAVEEEVVE